MQRATRTEKVGRMARALGPSRSIREHAWMHVPRDWDGFTVVQFDRSSGR